MGSINDAKKAPVENMASVMDTFDTSIAPKNVIQCKAMMMPAIESLSKDLGLMLILTFATLTYTNIKIEAMTILNHTKGMAVMVISSPKIAVNPAIKTKK